MLGGVLAVEGVGEVEEEFGDASGGLVAEFVGYEQARQIHRRSSATACSRCSAVTVRAWLSAAAVRGVVGDTVDEPGQPARALEQGFDGGGFEQGELAAGQTQAVGEVGVEFVAVESIEVVTHDEALGERFVHGHGEAAAQLGEPDEQQAHAGLGVHDEVGQICRRRHI